MTGGGELGGQRILVVEDDYYLAMETAKAVSAAGAVVLGPCASKEDALAVIERCVPTAAVVDINLGIGPSFDLALALRGRGVPLVFITGYDEDVVPRELADVPRLQKPVDLAAIVRSVAA